MQHIRNFAELTADIGSAGQPTLKQFSNIARNGYEGVINLAMLDHQDAIESEGSAVTSLGMSYFHIPVSFDAPKPSHIRIFCELMDTLGASGIDTGGSPALSQGDRKSFANNLDKLLYKSAKN